MAGVTLLSVPSIAYGGYFLLTVLSGMHDELQLTDFQKAMFRAGHAHAGVLVILSLVALLFVDESAYNARWKWIARVSIPIAALLVSGGFFAAAIGKGINQPNAFIAILYVGIAVLVFGLVVLGIGLVKKR